jgi:uncharacterized protein YceK
MKMFLFFLLLTIVLVVGNAMVLLRTAKKPKVPETVKPKPYAKDDDSSW